MITYDTTRDSEQLRSVKGDIRDWIMRYEWNPEPSRRRTLFLFSRRRGQSVAPSTNSLPGRGHAAAAQHRQLLAVAAFDSSNPGPNRHPNTTGFDQLNTSFRHGSAARSIRRQILLKASRRW